MGMVYLFKQGELQELVTLLNGKMQQVQKDFIWMILERLIFKIVLQQVLEL